MRSKAGTPGKRSERGGGGISFAVPCVGVGLPLISCLHVLLVLAGNLAKGLQIKLFAILVSLISARTVKKGWGKREKDEREVEKGHSKFNWLSA